MRRCRTGLWLLALPVPGAWAQAVPPLEGEAYRLAAEAYRRQQTGDLPGAMQSAEAALARAPGHPQLLGLKRDLCFASGDLAGAEALNAALLAAASGDARLHLFNVYLRQRQGRLAEALAEADRLMGMPGAPGETHRQARLAAADLLQAMGRPLEALARLEPLAAEGAADVLSRRAFLLLAARRPAEAIAAFHEALAPGPDPPARRTLLLGLRDAARAAGQGGEELAALQALRALEPGDRRLALDLAYALLARKRDAEALAQFEAGLDAQSPPGAWLDAAYAAKRLGRNAEAARYFARGLEARQAAGQGSPETDYGLRREVESLGRTWGFVSGTAFRQGGLLPGLASQERVLQEGLEAYWQPPGLARNGRLVQVFVQAFETLYTRSDSVTGGPTLQGAIGVRAKPFEGENLVLAAEKLVGLGRYALDDWLFRVAYSRDEGLDLRPWQDRWTYWSLYTEGATFARSGHSLVQAEIRAGEAWRIPAAGGHTVIAPHLVLAGDFDNRLAPRPSAGLGLGASLRHWFREDRQHAPASWLELTVQARAQLTVASRGGGLFLTLTCWY